MTKYFIFQYTTAIGNDKDDSFFDENALFELMDTNEDSNEKILPADSPDARSVVAVTEVVVM